MTTRAVALTVQQLASKPFVVSALQNPHHPHSVLSFFYGVDTTTPAGRDQLRNMPELFASMEKLWYQGGPQYDSLCQPFAETVKQAGQHQLDGKDWDDTVDSYMAQIILTDQLARNIFRGQSEAFAFEETSLSLARLLSKKALRPDTTHDATTTTTTTTLPQGELYPAYMSFVVTALMHSECVADHQQGLELCELAKANVPPSHHTTWNQQADFCRGHKQVVDQFGRYPHRNRAKGRTSTPEELAWLASDDVPLWAKSQG